jgi:predicted nucleotidyltransferase
MQERDMAINNLIYKAQIGSNLYGTVTKDSDKDYMGIFIPNKDYILGNKRCEQVILSEKNSKSIRNQKGDIDFIIYSLPKFIHLATGNNPNIVELFFVNHTNELFCNEFGKKLKESYKLFISKRVYHTFKGYSYSQRKKLEIKKENMTGRKELAEQFGYDTKFASHLLRLLVECQQLLLEGRLDLPLLQNNLIRDVKLGKYDLQWVLNKADELEKSVDRIYETCQLQSSPDVESINKLQIELIEEFWRKNDK